MAFFAYSVCFRGHLLRDGAGAANPEKSADRLPSLASARGSPATRPVVSSVASFLQADVPAFAPCFNNPTYTAHTVSQLRTLGFRRIVPVDGGSTYPPMRDLLTASADAVSVVLLLDNSGPRHVFLDPASFALLRHFCISDPDLAFNPAMPTDFLGDLAALAARERVGKAGLALDLSDRDAMRDEPMLIGERTWQIWAWEDQFWHDELKPLRPGGDPV
jgi:hypothetical protein